MTTTCLVLAALLLAAEPATQASMDLPAAYKTGGMPLLEALAQRSTSRAFDTRELSQQQLSDLLWAAFGINRPDGKRTAPSAMNYQETDIYVLLRQGAFLYEPKGHRLEPVVAEDIRRLGGSQEFVRDAPVTLVFVADLLRMGETPSSQKTTWAAIATGCISQNVYLYAASEGLATGIRAFVDRDALGARLGLRPDQVILAAQSVGYPKP